MSEICSTFCSTRSIAEFHKLAGVPTESILLYSFLSIFAVGFG